MTSVIMMSVIMMSVCHCDECHYDECHYDECHYDESHYDDCRGTLNSIKAEPFCREIVEKPKIVLEKEKQA